ncbi:MAG: L-histidine N(alpha)-methyltransferase, partial [Limisphaerales bacterium]
ADGTTAFKIENGQSNLKRISAYFRFKRPRQISIDDESFAFKAGEIIRLFYSYRYTVDRIRKLLSSHGLQVRGQWIAGSGEEGVFLCVS